MWRCGRCDRRFAQVGQTHSCGRVGFQRRIIFAAVNRIGPRDLDAHLHIRDAAELAAWVREAYGA